MHFFQQLGSNEKFGGRFNDRRGFIAEFAPAERAQFG